MDRLEETRIVRKKVTDSELGEAGRKGFSHRSTNSHRNEGSVSFSLSLVSLSGSFRPFCLLFLPGSLSFFQSSFFTFLLFVFLCFTLHNSLLVFCFPSSGLCFSCTVFHSQLWISFCLLFCLAVLYWFPFLAFSCAPSTVLEFTYYCFRLSVGHCFCPFREFRLLLGRERYVLFTLRFKKDVHWWNIILMGNSTRRTALEKSRRSQKIVVSTFQLLLSWTQKTNDIQPVLKWTQKWVLTFFGNQTNK